MVDNKETSAKNLAENTVGDLGHVGRAWARYGLSIGQLALEASAVTLEKTASLLANISGAFAKTDEEKRREEEQKREAAKVEPTMPRPKDPTR